MAEFEPTRSGASARSKASRRNSTRARSSSNNTPRLVRSLTGQHLDDQSVYHETTYGETDGESTSSGRLEKEDEEEARAAGMDKEIEMRGGTVNEKDLEAPLEKTKTSRSAKDPNLVWSSFWYTDCWFAERNPDSVLGDLGRS